MNVPALRKLYSLMCAIPAREISLNLFYMRSPDTGCVWGCGLGYAAKFELCGLHLETGMGLPEFTSEAGVEYKGLYAAEKAFGVTGQESMDLFCAAHKSRYDGAASDHKAMWLNRVECFFNEKGLSLGEPVVVDVPALV